MSTAVTPTTPAAALRCCRTTAALADSTGRRAGWVPRAVGNLALLVHVLTSLQGGQPVNYPRFNGNDTHHLPSAADEETRVELLQRLQAGLCWRRGPAGASQAETPGGCRIYRTSSGYVVWLQDQHGCNHQRLHEGPTLDDVLDVAANFEQSPAARR